MYDGVSRIGSGFAVLADGIPEDFSLETGGCHFVALLKGQCCSDAIVTGIIGQIVSIWRKSVFFILAQVWVC
jgi:hypothetical protein